MERKKIIEWTLRIFLAATFCFSAYTKLIAPGIIEIILVDHGLASSRELSAIYVRLLIGLEFALGLLFLQPFQIRKIVLPSAFVFLVGFSIYLAYTGYILGDQNNCGCFGEMLKMSPTESIIKNLILLIPVVFLYIMKRENMRNILLPALIVLFSITFVFAIAPIKQVKDFKFSSYTSFLGAGRVDLTSGNKLMAIFNTECDHCQETAKELAHLRNKKNFPDLYVLFFTEGSVSVDSFKAITKSNFPYRMITTKEFFDLIGQSPPRIYWLKDGNINATWDKDFKKNIIASFSIQE